MQKLNIKYSKLWPGRSPGLDQTPLRGAALRQRLLNFTFCILIFDLLGGALPARACRFNVREVGFVDLGIEPYYLYGLLNQDTPEDVVSSFKTICEATLMDSNIKVEIIDIDQQKDHPAVKHLNSQSVQTLPATVLVSPDGQLLMVPIAKPDRPFKETLQSALDSITSSPKRQEILEQVCKTYGVVLLIEGDDPQENNRAKQAASAAIEQVRSQMEWLPKPIAHAPVLVVVDQKSLSQEKILLWSLGLEAEQISEPHAAIVYGRARWIGPMFVGKQITEDNLGAILFVIGADCECGFDHRWLQGTMLPAKWDQNLQALAAETLEFDPESPMIKMEVGSIVARGYSYYPGVPLDYRELAVDSEPVSETQPQKFEIRNSKFEIPAEGGQSHSSLKRPLYFIAGLAVLIIAVGLLIVLRRVRN